MRCETKKSVMENFRSSFLSCDASVPPSDDDSWTCDMCSYENVDQTNPMCSVCGVRQDNTAEKECADDSSDSDHSTDTDCTDDTESSTKSNKEKTNEAIKKILKHGYDKRWKEEVAVFDMLRKKANRRKRAVMKKKERKAKKLSNSSTSRRRLPDDGDDRPPTLMCVNVDESDISVTSDVSTNDIVLRF